MKVIDVDNQSSEVLVAHLRNPAIYRRRKNWMELRLRAAEEIERLTTEGRDRENAMYRFFRHIQDQIEKQSGWMQFDYYHPEIDVYEFNRFSDALGDKSDHARWSDLLERSTVSFLGKLTPEKMKEIADRWNLPESERIQTPEQERCKTCNGTGCPFTHYQDVCGVHHCPDCEPKHD